MKRWLILVPLFLSLSLSACFRTRSEIAEEQQDREMKQSLSQSLAQQAEAIDRLQEHMGKLQGKLEELEYQHRKESGASASGQQDLSKKIADLVSRLEALEKSNGLLVDEMKKVQEDNLQLLKSAQEGQMHPSAGPVSKKKGTDLYAEGLSAYKKNDCDSAAAALGSFVKSQPKSKHYMEANYYLGDCLYRMKQYSEAILALGVVHEKALKSAFGRKATLKIAESFKAMGKDKDARAFAQILQQTAAGSPEAKAAKRYLK